MGQSVLEWSDTTTVVSDATVGYTRPKIVLNAAGEPIVMWGKANNQGVYVAKWTGNGFGSPVKVTPNGIDAFVQYWAGPDMAASGDTIFVTFKAQPEISGFIYVVRSTDGGNTFGDTMRVSDENWSRFPAVAVRPGGHPVITYMQFDPNFKAARYAVAPSFNGGLTFAPPVNISGQFASGEVCDCCPGDIIAQQGKVVLLFRNNDNNTRDLWAAISGDGGNSFTVGTDIDSNNWVINACPSSGPSAFLNGDSLFFTWMSGASGYNHINIGSASENTLNLGLNQDISVVGNVNQNYPKISGEGDDIAVIWEENNSGNKDIKFMWSDSGISGLKGGMIFTVNVNTPSAQINPDMIYSNGTFHMVWQDNDANQVTYRKADLVPLGLGDAIRDKVNIFPNPAIDRFKVSFDAPTGIEQLTIYTSTGQAVLQRTFPRQPVIEVETDEFPTGLYFITIVSAGQLSTGKLVISK